MNTPPLQPLGRADEPDYEVPGVRGKAQVAPRSRHDASPQGFEHLTSRAEFTEKAIGAGLREARKLNVPGAAVVIVVVLAALAVYFVPPIRTASSEPVWTKVDQSKFEAVIAGQIASVAAQLESERKERKERDEKQEAQMKEWREIANLQAINLARLIDREQDLRERVKALESRPK